MAHRHGRVRARTHTVMIMPLLWAGSGTYSGHLGPCGYDLYCLVPHPPFPRRWLPGNELPPKGTLFVKVFQGNRLQMSYATQWLKKKCVCGDNIKMSWPYILGKCGPVCWEGLTVRVAMPRKAVGSRTWLLGCRGNGCWRLFLSSQQFGWLQDGLGNKDSAEISPHFPQAQLPALDISKLALQWALSLWEPRIKYKARSIYLLSLVTKLIFARAQLWSGVNEDEAEAELGHI